MVIRKNFPFILISFGVKVLSWNLLCGFWMEVSKRVVFSIHGGVKVWNFPRKGLRFPLEGVTFKFPFGFPKSFFPLGGFNPFQAKGPFRRLFRLVPFKGFFP